MPDPIIFNFDNPSEEEIQRFIDFSNNPDELDNPAIYHLNASEKSFFGLTFPLTYEVGATGFFPRARTLKEQAKSNLKNVLLTRKGERLGLPDFGSLLTDLLFEPATPELGTQIEAEIREVVEKQLSYITLIEVNTLLDEADTNTIVVRMSFTVDVNDPSAIDTVSITANPQMVD
tara:strand:- start:95 stop:619 length:525 start_codon:yes stop_codon:yes gene_type:complete